MYIYIYIYIYTYTYSNQTTTFSRGRGPRLLLGPGVRDLGWALSRSVPSNFIMFSLYFLFLCIFFCIYHFRCCFFCYFFKHIFVCFVCSLILLLCWPFLFLFLFGRSRRTSMPRSFGGESCGSPYVFRDFAPHTGVCENITPFGRAFALQSSSRNSSPAPDLFSK